MIKHKRRFIALTIAFPLAFAATTLPAQASEGEDIAQRTAAVVEELGTSPVADNTTVTLPKRGGGNLVVDGEDGKLKIDLPGKGKGAVDNDDLTVVYDAPIADTSVAAQPTEDGARVIISIDSPAAPERFDFPVSGDVDRLILDETDGSVFAFDADNEPVGYFETPWAVDANGTAVPTRFEVDGLTLTQVVEHRGGDFQYGIVADPAWNGKWAKKIAKLFMACLGIAGMTELSLRKLFPTVQDAAKFVVRRLGVFAAISCGGGIIRELI